MAKYIDREKALNSLENTAKYYEMPNADEWTRGIHYGLIHGIDNIVDNLPTIKAIPIPDNATNGDMVKAIFPNIKFYDKSQVTDIVNWEIFSGIPWEEMNGANISADKDWWNTPYKAESEV